MADSTVFNNLALIDGSGTGPIEKACLLVEKGKVAYAGSMKELPGTTPDTSTLDCTGYTAIPGLIDCHIHLDCHGFADTFQENLVEERLRTLRAAKEMEATLRAGFTTVRNVGSVNQIDLVIKAAIEQGICQGPRILAAGKIISMTCSGTEYFAGMYRIADGRQECRKAAREQLRAGADLLKVMATGAVMNPGGVPGAPQLDEEEIRVVVEEGLKLGKHTAAHAHGARGILQAVRAGVRTIEHGTMADDTALEAMAQAGTYLVPTMNLRELFEQHAGTIPAFMLEKSRAMRANHTQAVKKALALGIPVAMGTDAGTNYNFHGNNAAELLYLVKQGIMDPASALRSATSIAAQALGIDDTTGTLTPGKDADFILLKSNPLEDITILTDPQSFAGVYKGGEKV